MRSRQRFAPLFLLIAAAFGLIILPVRARAADLAPSPAEARLKADVNFLAHDEREGREPGTKGIEAAADYIAAAFQKAGLKPAPGADGFFQRFTLGGTPVVGKPLDLALVGPDGKHIEAQKGDFTPLAIGTGGTLRDVPIVFAGYGITAKDSATHLDYNDYAGLDVKGKAVLLLRRQPRQGNAESPFSPNRDSRFAFLVHKATNAYQHGAVAVLLVNDHASTKASKDELLGFAHGGTEVFSKLPFLMLTRAFADKLLAAANEPSLQELESRIDGALKPQSRVIKGWTVDAQITITRTEVETKNVIGVLEGSGPVADETVVIGAHYDHLGHGGLFSGSLAILSKDIHNGADDNASGTAMVMEMARRLARRADPLPRRVVFMAFSGEERGLLGSRYYVEHPLFPLSNTVMMINFDMVGRLNDKNELTMIGTGTTNGMDAIVEALGPSAGLKIKKVTGLSDGFGGSDHQSFYGKKVPVLFAFTGVHLDYHRPSDDPDRINFGGMARIADYLELIALDVIRRPKRPDYVVLAPPARRPLQGGRGTTTASLGTMPDYGDESKQGMKIAGVRPGGPADKGGLRQGDVIVGLGGKPIATIYDFMECIGNHKPGDTVDLAFKRDGKEQRVKVTLEARARE